MQVQDWLDVLLHGSPWLLLVISVALNLSKNISIKNEIKFFEGLATSFDLSQAQRQLYMAQQDYLQSMLNILLKRVDLESLLNTPLKR